MSIDQQCTENETVEVKKSGKKFKCMLTRVSSIADRLRPSLRLRAADADRSNRLARVFLLALSAVEKPTACDCRRRCCCCCCSILFNFFNFRSSSLRCFSIFFNAFFSARFVSFFFSGLPCCWFWYAFRWLPSLLPSLSSHLARLYLVEEEEVDRSDRSERELEAVRLLRKGLLMRPSSSLLYSSGCCCCWRCCKCVGRIMGSVDQVLLCTVDPKLRM